MKLVRSSETLVDFRQSIQKTELFTGTCSLIGESRIQVLLHKKAKRTKVEEEAEGIVF
jgi:hypothetical protein